MSWIERKWPDAQDEVRAEVLAMSLLGGWDVALCCKRCRKLRLYTTEQLILSPHARPFLALPRAAFADQANCECGHVGAWINHSGHDFRDPFMREGGRDTGMTTWQAEDVHLRRRLAWLRGPLELSDLCWVEKRAWCGDHPTWAPRWPEIEGAPLSDAAKADPELRR